REAYITYLEKYPEGLHTDEANEKIAAFEEKELEEARLREESLQKQRDEQARIKKERSAEEERSKAEAAQKDDEAYSKAEADNTVQAYSSYLRAFPLGKNVDKARDKLSALDKEAAEKERANAEELAKRDNEAFRIAMNRNTKESYSTYLISFPDGRNSNDAKEKIAFIEKQETFNKKISTELSLLSITMADISAGTFKMGSNNGDSDEKPVRTIALSAFTMSNTEVTQAQYSSVMSSNPSFHKLDDNCPVEKVSWKDAITFCNRLSERLGLEKCYNLSTGECDFSKNGFRLPTEAEWEHACRGNIGSEYNSGNGESALNRAGWYQRNSGEKTHPVAQKAANAFGLYDMHGNVWEWCNDWYSKRSYEIDKKTENPTGVSNSKERVLRGGSWLDWPKDCTSSKRRDFNPDKNYSDVGFRIVRR
ncbi:MAG: SUMF1/EgtB/PvdO family nonheme iron enzyme, partial [Candidatus Latescibacteria bacterium]|nr:SUMF1/EgtB/PvdO family nonheme iron enzyme [Candidatus Latescibacterota bacterium]